MLRAKGELPNHQVENLLHLSHRLELGGNISWSQERPSLLGVKKGTTVPQERFATLGAGRANSWRYILGKV